MLRPAARLRPLPALGLGWGALACGGLGAAELPLSELPAPATQRVDYVRDILPIFQESCFQCHGPERPKGGLRLDNREDAVAGGDYGPDIIPGNSRDSQLIHFVARLEPEWEMPPTGEGDPLRPHEIALLRAWIDQGADYGEFNLRPAARLNYLLETEVGRIDVSGDVEKFRQLTGREPGWSFGVKQFTAEGRTAEGDYVRLDGRALTSPHDYRAALEWERPEHFWIKAGAEEWRSYDDTSGGYYAPFGNTLYELAGSRAMDHGRAWLEVGLQVPEAPRLSARYEHRYREGDESLTQWGPVRFPIRSIYPATKAVDETVHQLTFTIQHEIAGWEIEDRFQAEWYSLETSRQLGLLTDQSKAGPDKITRVDERTEWFQGANTFRFEKWLRDSWLISGGHLYSFLDGDAAFDQTTFLTPLAGQPPTSGFTAFGAFADRFTTANRIVFDQRSHVGSLATLFRPIETLSFDLAVQGEWTRQTGLSDYDFRAGAPDPVTGRPPGVPVLAVSKVDQRRLTEQAGVRFTGVPATTLYATAEWRQDDTGHFEEETFAGFPSYLRDTDAKADEQRYRAGLNTAPFARTMFSARGTLTRRETDYVPRPGDLSPGANGAGYTGFIAGRDVRSEAAGAEVSLRLWRGWRSSIQYDFVQSEVENTTRELLSPPTPAGTITSARQEGHVAGVQLSGMVRTGWLLMAGGTYGDSTLRTFANESPTVVPYEGKTWSAHLHSTWTVSEVTDLTAAYRWSRADFAQDNVAASLPAGIRYDWHELRFGVGRRLTPELAVKVEYYFLDYAEPTAGGGNDLTAHGFFSSLAFNW